MNIYREHCLVIVFLIISESLGLCPEELRQNLTNVPFSSGQRISSEGLVFDKSDYFEDEGTIWGCPCAIKECVRKCCPKFMSISKETKSCVESNRSLDIPIYQKTKVVNKTLSDFAIVPKFFETFEYLAQLSVNLFVQENGYLLHNDEYYPQVDYCIDIFDDDFGALVRRKPQDVETLNAYIYGMIISMPFLLATFLVYAILPDRNLHQRALMLYVLTLCISYVLLVTVNLAVFDEPLCPIVGYLTMFFFMVSFFWINVICFDIWYTFSGGRGFVGSKRSSETRRFLLYNIYAWGVPLLHIGVVLLMQHIILPADSKHNPNVGTGKCFLNDGYPNLWYFYGEAGILIIINVILFLRTAFKIRQVKKETSMLKHSDSQRHAYEKDKQRFNLYLKLLFAMGVNWSMEVISWLVNWQTKNKYVEVWYLTDFFNAVYGVFIFFIFVFKKKTWKLLQKRYYNFVGKPHLAQTMTSSNTRTSHYSSTNYSTAETTLTDRTNGAGPEEVRLRQVS